MNINKKPKQGSKGGKNFTDGGWVLITLKLDCFHRKLSSYKYRIDTLTFQEKFRCFFNIINNIIITLFILDFQL